MTLDFREQAEECRRMARQARTDADRKAWVKLADDWTELAQAAEKKSASAKSSESW